MMATWFIVEVDSNRLHPSIVSVSGIIYIAFKSLKDKKESLNCLHNGPKTFLRTKEKGTMAEPESPKIWKVWWFGREFWLSLPPRPPTSLTPLLRTPAAVWERLAPLDQPSPTRQTFHCKFSHALTLYRQHPQNLRNVKYVKTTNPRDGPLAAVFPFDGHKLQDGQFGYWVESLSSFRIFFPSTRW